MKRVKRGTIPQRKPKVSGKIQGPKKCEGEAEKQPAKTVNVACKYLSKKGVKNKQMVTIG